MPAAIMSVVTMLLPLAIKLIMYWIDKKRDDNELRRQFLEIIEKMDHDIPTRMRERHRQQIERIKLKIIESQK